MAFAGSGPLPDLIGSVLKLLGLDLAVPAWFETGSHGKLGWRYRDG
jgi:hypothetical protein